MMRRLERIACGIFLALLFWAVAAAPSCLGGGYRVLRKVCTNCGTEVPLSSQVGQRCPHCGTYWSFEKKTGGTAKQLGGAAKVELKAGEEWMKERPGSPGEVTVVLPNGSHFAGAVVCDDERRIRIKTNIGEMEWDKKAVAQIIRFGGLPAAAPKPPLPVRESPVPRCQIWICGLAKGPGKMEVTLQLDWQQGLPPVEQNKVTVVFLFQPKIVAQLSPQILAETREYSSLLVSKDMYRMMSRVEARDADGSVCQGAILLFFTGSGSPLRLQESGEQTFTVPIQPGGEWAGAPAIMGKGVLSIAIFKEDDPELVLHLFPQLFMSKIYQQLSDVINQPIDLSQ